MRVFITCVAFYSSSNDFTRWDLEPLDNDIKRTVRHYIRVAILMMLVCESVYDIRSLNGGLLLVLVIYKKKNKAVSIACNCENLCIRFRTPESAACLLLVSFPCC